MKAKYLIIMAATAMTFAACSSDESVDNSGPVEAQISAGVSGAATRAIDDKWEADAIGVMVTGSTSSTSNMATLYKNVKYTTTSNTSEAADFTAETCKGIFFQDASETVTFAAYGPYVETASAATLPGTEGAISGSTSSQNTRTLQGAFDYIYASGATATKSTPTVEFSGDNKFAHKMSRLIIVVVPGTDNDITADDVLGGTYTLSGLNHTGTFNVTTGTATATGTTTTADWSLTNNSLITEDETTQVTFTSILYPQTLSSALTFKAKIGGQTYTNTSIKPALEAGTSYTYTITVKKTGIEISGCTITNWNPGTGGSGNATM